MLDILAGIVDALVFIASYLASPPPKSLLLAQQSLALPGLVADVAAFIVAVALAGRMKALLAQLSKAKWWQALAVLGLACIATGVLAYTYAPALIKLQMEEAQRLGLQTTSMPKEALSFFAMFSAIGASIGVVIAVAVGALIAFIAAKLLGAEKLGFLESFKAYSLGQLGGIVGSLISITAYASTSSLVALFATSRAISTPITIAILVGYAAGLAEKGVERKYVASILAPLIILGAIGLLAYLWSMSSLSAVASTRTS